jgi:hypothetical protein
VPRSHGGLELDFPATLNIFRAISKLDGSVGWTTAIGSSGALIASLLPRGLYDRVALNAALAFVVADAVADIPEGMARARGAIASGAARAALDALRGERIKEVVS